MSEALTKEQFVELLTPLAEALRRLDVDASDAAAQADAIAPFGGGQVRAIRAAATASVDSGWLLPKEAGGVRFGRGGRDGQAARERRGEAARRDAARRLHT